MCCHVWFYISFCQIYVFVFFLGSVFKCMLWQCCNNALVRSVHGNTWLGLGKDRVLARHTCFGRHNNSRNMSLWEISSGVLLSNHVVFWQKCSAVSHFETHLELRSVAFGSLGLLHRHPISPWYERFRSYTCKGTLRWQMLSTWLRSQWNAWMWTQPPTCLPCDWAIEAYNRAAREAVGFL